MKNIYIILVSLVVICSGCSEFLTLKPQDELIREEYWKTESDVVAYLGTAYGKMEKILNDIYYWAELRGGLISPNYKYVKPTTLDFFNFSINTYNEKVKWNDFYIVINCANTILEYAQLAKDNDQTFTEEAFNGYIAEAYFIRSLCYFYLVKTFKEVPFITKSYSKDDQDFDFAKSSEQEIIDQLIGDLNGIVNTAFQSNYFDSREFQKGRVTANAIYALLADLHLWNNNYQECINSCKNINGIFLVKPGEEYFSIFGDEGNSDESIFELQFDRNEYGTDSRMKEIFQITSNGSDGNKETLVSDELKALYLENDLRQNLDTKDVTYNSADESIWKYEGLEPFDATVLQNHRSITYCDANWIFYRYADIILMMAEAYAEMDDFTNSTEQLNKIKSRAGISSYLQGSNKISLVSEIINERAREFVGEGKRWFDLVRICRRDIDNRLPIISSAVISNVDPSNRSAVATKIKDVNSWFLPIYFEELQLNSLLEQNPFYD